MARLIGAVLAAGLACVGAARAAEPAVIPLHRPGAAPAATPPERTEKLMGELRVRNVSQPSLTVFAPEPGKANGAAVIVAPGGGFVMLSWESEGVLVAKRLAEQGVTAFVLKYRLAKTPEDPTAFLADFMRRMRAAGASATPGAPPQVMQQPLEDEPEAAADAADAIRLVRGRAGEWGVDPKRIGFLGFSAGGITAAHVATGAASGRPDFVGVIYGALRDPVPAGAPPAFIATAADDPLLKDAAIPMFEAWRKAGAPAELHLYERGGHGFGLTPKGTSSDHWFDEFLWWLQARGLLKPRSN